MKGLVTEIKASYWLAITVLAISCFAMLQNAVTIFYSQNIIPEWASMNPLTASALILCGVLTLLLRHLFLTSDKKFPRLARKLTITCLALSALITAFGIFELNSDLIGIHLTWDDLLLGQGSDIINSSQTSSSSSAVSSTLTLLAGLGFFTLILAPTWPWIWQVFPCLGIILATLLSNSFMFDMKVIRGDLVFSTVAFNTSIAFLFVFLALLFLRADLGLFRPFNSSNVGARILRTRGPLMFLWFVAMAKILQLGAKAGWYDVPLGLAVFITLSTASFFFVFFALAIEFNAAHERLRASEFFSKTVLDVCPGMITIFKADDNMYTFASSRIASILGYTPLEIVGVPDILSQLVHPDDKESIVRERQKIKELPDEATYTYSFRWKCSDGSWKTLLTTSSPYKRNAEGQVIEILSSSMDITDLEHLQLSLEKTNRELTAERQKLLMSNRDLEIFAGVAAHDLKSPLQSVISWIGVLEESLNPFQNEMVEKSLRFIKSGATKSISMINDLLNISRLDSNQASHVECDAKNILYSVIQTLDQEIKKTEAQVIVRDLPKVRCNPVQIETIFSNLIRNSVNYRHPNRKLEIEIDGCELSKEYEFCVRDNGLGIPKEHSETIFDLFKRIHADDEHPGNGMGLAYCRKVVELMGGRIWVESEIGEGSTFRFSLPKVPASATTDQTISKATSYQAAAAPQS